MNTFRARQAAGERPVYTAPSLIRSRRSASYKGSTAPAGEPDQLQWFTANLRISLRPEISPNGRCRGHATEGAQATASPVLVSPPFALPLSAHTLCIEWASERSPHACLSPILHGLYAGADPARPGAAGRFGGGESPPAFPFSRGVDTNPGRSPSHPPPRHAANSPIDRARTRSAHVLRSLSTKTAVPALRPRRQPAPPPKAGRCCQVACARSRPSDVTGSKLGDIIAPCVHDPVR